MRLAKKLIVYIDLKASADTGCLKIDRSFKFLSRKDNRRPVDSRLVTVGIRRIPDVLVAYRVLMTRRVVIESFGLFVKKVLRESVAFRLPC